jgi:hypothetical protein
MGMKSRRTTVKWDTVGKICKVKRIGGLESSRSWVQTPVLPKNKKIVKIVKYPFCCPRKAVFRPRMLIFWISFCKYWEHCIGCLVYKWFAFCLFVCLFGAGDRTRGLCILGQQSITEPNPQPVKILTSYMISLFPIVFVSSTINRKDFNSVINVSLR